MTPGLFVLCAAVLVAVGLGLWRRAHDGRFEDRDRRTGPAPTEEPESSQHPGEAARLVAASGAELGERATLLQFSSAFCAPCRTTRVILADVAGAVPGVRHVDVDAELHLDAVRRLQVSRTPTTLVLDGSGREVSRAAGAPTRQQVLSALDLVVSQNMDG